MAFDAPFSTKQRVILPCDPAYGSIHQQVSGGAEIALEEAYLVSVPPPLQARGVPQDEWSTFLEEIDLAYKLDQPLTLACGAFSSCLPMIVCPFLYHVAKKRRTALAAAFDNFNTAVLNPRGMHARMQRVYQEEIIAGEYNTSHKWWIAVSMTEEDAARLKQESTYLKFLPQAGSFEPEVGPPVGGCANLNMTPL